MYKNDVKKAREEGLKTIERATKEAQNALQSAGTQAEEEIGSGMEKTWDELKQYTQTADASTKELGGKMDEIGTTLKN